MRHRSRSRRATPCASFDGSGYAKGNFEALSTTSSKYLFPASAVFGNFCKSTWSTSHGSRNVAGSIANCWLRDRFLRLHPHDRTYSRASLHMPDQWNRSCNNANVLATPGCPCLQCIRGVGLILGSWGWQVPTSVLPMSRFAPSQATGGSGRLLGTC